MPRQISPRLAPLGLLTSALLACSGPAPSAEVAVESPEGTVRLTEPQIAAAGIVTAQGLSQQLRQAVRVPGSVNSPDTAQATVGSIVEGRVVRVRVLPGDRVRRGQPLVEIHTHELSDAQAQLQSAEAELEFSSQAADRAQALFDAGAISLQEFQRRTSDVANDRAEQQRATEMVEHLYPSATGNSTAVAPRAGVVFSVEARSGQAVLPGTPLVHLGTTDVLWVTAFVPENTSAVLSRGDEVAVEFRSAPGATTTARLVQTGEFVDPTNRSVEMRFELTSIPDGVRPGSFATVDIAAASSFEGIELAEAAAVRMGEEDAVFIVAEPGLYRAVPVTVTSLRPGFVAVEGIPEGAEIVVEGAYFLKSAMEATGEGVEHD